MGNLTSRASTFTQADFDKMYQARVPSGTLVSATELTQRLAGFAPTSALTGLPPTGDIVRRTELSGFAPASALANFAPTSTLTGNTSPLTSRTLWCADGSTTCNVPTNRSLQIADFNIRTATTPTGNRLCIQGGKGSPFCFDGTNIVQG